MGDLTFPVVKRRLNKEKHAFTVTLNPAIVYIEPKPEHYDAPRLPDDCLFDEYPKYLTEGSQLIPNGIQ